MLYTQDNMKKRCLKCHINRSYGQRRRKRRHLSRKAQRSKSKHHSKGPAKRTAEDDVRFAESLERLIQKIKTE